MRQTLRERLLSRLVIDPSGCLLWTGARSDQGYGQIHIGSTKDGASRIAYVHRLMYEWFVDLIPDGLQIDHLCRTRHCGSPAHLQAVSQRENILRGQSPSALSSRLTHCINGGHEFSDVNTYRTPDGRRQCRPCRRERRRYLGTRIWSCPDCDADLEHEFDTLWCPKCQHTVPYPAVGAPDDDD